MHDKKIGFVLWGASGRMGSEVLRLLGPASEFELLQAVVAPGSSKLGRPASGALAYSAPPSSLPESVAVVVDFSSPLALLGLLECAVAARVPVVSGTTGLTPEEHEVLVRASQIIPVFWAPNFSVGLAALIEGLRAVLPRLEGFEVEIVESHHGAKKDSPSGTAARLAEVVEGQRGGERVHGRHGLRVRVPGEIALHSVRGGSNPGRHEVHLLGPAEDVILTHQVYSREVFARGALGAAKFLLSRKPGLYGMSDWIGRV